MKVISVKAGSKKVFKPDQNPKNIPAGSKKGSEGPKWDRRKIKKKRIYFQTQN